MSLIYRSNDCKSVQINQSVQHITFGYTTWQIDQEEESCTDIQLELFAQERLFVDGMPFVATFVKDHT